MMRPLAYAFVGVLWLTVALFAWMNAADVTTGLAAGGWGVLLLPAYYIFPAAIFALAWQRMLEEHAPSFQILFRGTLVGSAANWLLPVAQIGGDALRAWIAVRAGVPGRVAGASVLVDKAAMLASQVAFSLIGMGAFLLIYGAEPLPLVVLAGLLVLGALTWAFIWRQRVGMLGPVAHRGRRIFGQDRLATIAGGADALDDAMREIHGRPRVFLIGVALRLAGWSVLAGEVWIAMRLLGRPLDMPQALMLESLGQAVRLVAFFVPGALGVLEAWYMAIGATMGFGAETGLTLSLLKRIRELAIGVPVLAIWPAGWIR